MSVCIFLKGDFDKISTQYLKLNVNYELDKTHKTQVKTGFTIKQVTYTLRKKGAKRVLRLSRIWNPLLFFKGPLKVLNVPIVT